MAVLANPKRRVEKILATRNAVTRLPNLPQSIEVRILEPDVLDDMLPPGAVHQGIAVRAAPLEDLTLEEACLPPDGRPVLILDQVTDPQNVGGIFRSAAAFGARAIVMQDRKSPPFTGALAKAAVGGIELVDHVRAVNIARSVTTLAEGGYLTVALEGEADMTLAQALTDTRPAAIVLGAEGKGLRDLVSANCEVRARIPMLPAMESLNVSVAAAVALYEATRKK